MKSLSTSIACALALAAGVVSGATVRGAPRSDWKYAVGWDGVTLPADAIGAPAPSTDGAPSLVEDIAKRAIGGVFICTGTNWTGDCGYAVQPVNVCINLGSEWADKVSSFGPDRGTSCLAWSTKSCGQIPPEWGFSYPGDPTGGAGTRDPWDNKILSFRCSAS